MSASKNGLQSIRFIVQIVTPDERPGNRGFREAQIMSLPRYFVCHERHSTVLIPVSMSRAKGCLMLSAFIRKLYSFFTNSSTVFFNKKANKTNKKHYKIWKTHA